MVLGSSISVWSILAPHQRQRRLPIRYSETDVSYLQTQTLLQIHGMTPNLLEHFF